MSLETWKAAAAGLVLAAAVSMAPARASGIDVTLVDVGSFGNLNVAGNTIIDVDVGASTEIGSLGFDVTLTAFDPSWLSEMWVKIYNTAGTGGVLLRAAPNEYDYQYAGSASFAFVLDLRSLDLAFNPSADGLVHLQFYENPVDDLPGNDGVWNGTITLNAPVAAVPEPGTSTLVMLGLTFGALVARRRLPRRQG